MAVRNLHLWLTAKQLKEIKLLLKSASMYRSKEIERAYLRSIIKKLERQEKTNAQ